VSDELGRVCHPYLGTEAARPTRRAAFTHPERCPTAPRFWGTVLGLARGPVMGMGQDDEGTGPETIGRTVEPVQAG